MLVLLLSASDVFQIFTAPGAEAQVRADLLTRIKSGYMQDATGEYSAVIRNADPRSAGAQELGERIAAIDRMTISSFSLRTAGPGATARVEVRFAGDSSSDRVVTRYFNIRQHVWGTWWPGGETSPAFYRLRPW